MKKKQPLPKPKEFAPAPFTALKGLTVKTAAASSPAPPPPPPPPPPAEDEDDLDLFFRAVNDVRPLSTPGRREPGTAASPAQPLPALRVRKLEEAECQLFLKTLQGMDVRFQDEIPDEDDAFHPISASRLKQLKQGTIRIRMELDLHGLTRDEALENLGRFIDGAWQREIKAVLIITGKGNNSPGEPVLQAAVAGWLRDKGKLRVVEFAPAPRQMGGNGAFVVFLRPRVQE
jgi:DNA-nicking Smr family endonuclease